MLSLTYTTKRLNCRPLSRLEYPEFVNNVLQDQKIQEYFRIGSSYGEVIDFLYEMLNTDCIQIGIFSKSSNQLIGCINAYFFTKSTLLVEFFVFSYYRSCRYISEALQEFFAQCRSKCAVTDFRFEVEPSNQISISTLTKFGASHTEEKDFENGKRQFLVYELHL